MTAARLAVVCMVLLSSVCGLTVATPAAGAPTAGSHATLNHKDEAPKEGEHISTMEKYDEPVIASGKEDASADPDAPSMNTKVETIADMDHGAHENDSKGLVDAEEAPTSPPTLPGQPPHESWEGHVHPKKVVKDIDSDKDGKISEKELKARLNKVHTIAEKVRHVGGDGGVANYPGLTFNDTNTKGAKHVSKDEISKHLHATGHLESTGGAEGKPWKDPAHLETDAEGKKGLPAADDGPDVTGMKFAKPKMEEGFGGGDAPAVSDENHEAAGSDDHLLPESEVQLMAFNKRFDLADADGDGKLDVKEFKDFQHKRFPAVVALLSKAAIEEEVTNTMSTGDQDADGHLDKEEYGEVHTWLHALTHPEDLLSHLDQL